MSGLDAANEPRSWLTLSVLAVGIGLVVVDSTIANVVLPGIGKDLDLSAVDLAWVVDAYLIAFGGLLLVAGRAGDLAGRRVVFVAGLGLFTVASTMCGLAQSGNVLIAGRLLQGVGAALTAAVTLGMITSLFGDGRRRARAVGIYVAIMASGASVGLLLGGVLADWAGWRAVFLGNVPVAFGTWIVAMRRLRRDRRRSRLGDIAGREAAVATAGMMATVYGILAASEHGWGAADAWLSCGAGLSALVYFGWRERRSAAPLIPRAVWRRRSLRMAILVMCLIIPTLSGLSFLGVLYLRIVLGYSATKAGLAFLPLVVGYGSLSLFVSAKSLRVTRLRVRLYLGLALIFGGLVVLSIASVPASYVVDVLPAMVLAGLGSGLAIPPVVAAAMADATDDDSGVTSAIVNTAMQIGAALGVALFTAVAASRSAELERAGHTETQALVEGYQIAYLVGAAMVIVAGVAALSLVWRRDVGRGCSLG